VANAAGSSGSGWRAPPPTGSSGTVPVGAAPELSVVDLDGSRRRERLTHFTDYQGWKGAEGVVSDGGRFMLFQNGKSGQQAGAGFGIFLFDFAKAPRPR
jgi:hypothetical protein